MYRATLTADLKSESHPDLCFATTEDAALGYLMGPSHTAKLVEGFMHVARVTDWSKIADWSEACEAWAAAELTVSDDVPPMCYADRAEYREALAAAGFEGMIYDDAGPCNGYEHETIRVWGATCWTLARTEAHGWRSMAADGACRTESCPR